MNDEGPIIKCKCGEDLEPDFDVCPNCGKPLCPNPNCRRIIKAKWKICPKCKTPLSGWATPTHATNSTGTKPFVSSTSRPFVTGEQDDDGISLEEGEELLGRFVIKTSLGKGGFGSVYQAHDRERRDDVALKVVVSDSSQSEEAAQQLRQELRLRDRINDFSHIIRTYDIHTVDYKGVSLVLLPMEYANGGSLRSWLRAHKNNKEHRISEGLELFKQICFGVKAIHDAGLAHLDIKPENILLCGDGDNGTVKVSDFGISRNIEHFSMNVSSVTQAGLGTPYYMSPEQIDAPRQKDVGSCADIYSLGVILFEILDGDPPFDGTRKEVKKKHLGKEPPKLKDVDEIFASVVYKCLAKKAEDRFESVDAVLNALGEDALLPAEFEALLATEPDTPFISEPDIESKKLRDAIALYSGTKGSIDYEKAKELFLELSELGNPLGKMWVAQCYYLGSCHFQKDIEKSEKIAWEVIEQVKQLSEDGDSNAAFLLGSAYEYGLFLDQDYKKALDCYYQAAKAGESEAMLRLGIMFRDGIGVARDYKNAIEWYRKATGAGNAFAMVHLGFMYANGMGVTKDGQKALAWYRKARGAGYHWAAYYSGNIYKNGVGVTKDYKKAVELFCEAAEAGKVDAMYELGQMYEAGLGVTKDYEKAAEWYCKGAEGGSQDALKHLDYMYEYNKRPNVPKDYKEALALYHREANAGSSYAMVNLGSMCRLGHGVAQDYEEAIKWYEKSESTGNRRAMYELGLMYENGWGVTKNRKEAMKWYRRAVEEGESLAIKKMGITYKIERSLISVRYIVAWCYRHTVGLLNKLDREERLWLFSWLVRKGIKIALIAIVLGGTGVVVFKTRHNIVKYWLKYTQRQESNRRTIKEPERRVRGGANVKSSSAQPRTGDVITNSIGMKLTYLSPGEFIMGCSSQELNKMKAYNVGSTARPQHKVRITMGFFMGKTEVTQAEWRAIMGTNPGKFKGDIRPVETISWHEAVEFCQRLSQKEGKIYRLPTEAEWEYACRAGTKTPFYMGHRINTAYGCYSGKSVHGFGGNNAKKYSATAPVASFTSNPWGLYDMSGNVNEWCSDIWDEDYYKRSPLEDPKGPSNPPFINDERRIIRGGSWEESAGDCRSAHRYSFPPDSKNDIIGLRVVMIPKN